MRLEYLRSSGKNRVMRHSTQRISQAAREAEKMHKKKQKNQSNKLGDAHSTQKQEIIQQKEQLMLAVQTEMANIESLRKLKQRHLRQQTSSATTKHSAKSNKAKIRFLSRGDLTYLTFTQVDDFPMEINSLGARPIMRRKTCVITGKPARYVDPKTKFPYHDLAAYRALKEKYHNAEAEKTLADHQDKHANSKAAKQREKIRNRA